MGWGVVGSVRRKAKMTKFDPVICYWSLRSLLLKHLDFSQSWHVGRGNDERGISWGKIRSFVSVAACRSGSFCPSPFLSSFHPPLIFSKIKLRVLVQNNRFSAISFSRKFAKRYLTSSFSWICSIAYSEMNLNWIAVERSVNCDRLSFDFNWCFI